MFDKHLLHTFHSAMYDADMAKEIIERMKETENFTKQGLINAGQIYQRLAADMYLAAGYIEGGNS